MNHRTKFYSIMIISVLVGALWFAGELSVVVAASELDYSKGDFSGAVMNDLYNISYTDLGASSPVLSVDGADRSGFIEHVAIRAAFSVRSAVILMDAHDAMWEEMLGVEVFTGVPGTSFTSANIDDFAGYYDSKDSNGISIHLGTDMNDSDGDIGSNETLNEDSYRANLDASVFDTADYAGLNNSEMEGLNTMYDDLTDDLLETDEDETDWKEEANDIVVAGFANLESAVEAVIKERVSANTDPSIPTSRIRIDNYTISESYLEQVMSSSVADKIVESYNEAKNAGFLSNFRAKTPLKISRVSVGQTMTTFKDSATGAITTQGKKTFDTIRGSTAYTNALAFKDRIVTGAKSAITGIKEKVHTAFSKVTDAWTKLKSGTKKLLAKPMAWFNALSTRAKSILKWGIVILLIAVIAYVAFMIWQKQTMMKAISAGRR